MFLTQKETSLLKDLKETEQLCIDKYNRHAEAAKDTQLKELFRQLSNGEQQHFQLLSQLETGTVPPPPASGGNQKTFCAAYTAQSTPDKENDCYLCTDVLAGEKHASHLYDACVFEFCDENARNLLNTIQKQEQGHGKAIYDYMSANSMY